MMGKSVLVISVLAVWLFLTLGCRSQTLSASNNAPPDADNLSSTNRNLSAKQSETPNNLAGSKISQEFLDDKESLFVILGRIYTEDGKIELSEQFWGYEVVEEAESRPGDKITVDIMNCAGYLASATTTYQMKGGMRRVVLSPETISADVVEKIKRCSLTPDDKVVGSDVFAVKQSQKSRNGIKVNRANTKQLYESLVKDIAKMKPKKIQNGSLLPPSKIVKGDLFLEDDNWTDLDGDGQIDLVEFHNTPCDEKDTCTWIFRLIDGKWRIIDYVFPL